MCVKERLHAALSHSSLRERRGNNNRKARRVFIKTKEDNVLTIDPDFICSHSDLKAAFFFSLQSILLTLTLLLQPQLLCGDTSDSLSGISELFSIPALRTTDKIY
ncbi:hypothetical protein ATANTOWER_006007 [Ataeniobius toweri]|uniref:Uncharacterized protein n=1 Tax=Ataeniobius toweri TaxID=208326 RepID=A0ABU7BEH7_9TELE|nr:hypothetical protein [Ataeniobius toweri]